jgi:hypothetical protein
MLAPVLHPCGRNDPDGLVKVELGALGFSHFANTLASDERKAQGRAGSHVHPCII